MTTVEAPYDAEVEYLESTGTQWISLGINSASGYTFDLKLRLSPGTASGEHYIIGGADAPNRLYFGVMGKNWMIGYGSYYRVGSVTDETDYTISLIRNVGAQRLVVNGVTEFNADSTSNIASSVPWKLFTRTGSSMSQWNISAKLCYATVTQDGVGVVRDLIPIRFTNDLGQSEGAMYDKVSGQLFRNQGTGAFKYGADVRPYSTPVMGLHLMRDMGGMTARDYIQDGLVAMWDGIENAGYGVHDAASAKWVDLSGNGWSLTKNSGEFAADHYVLGGLRCATISTMPHGVQTIEIVFQNYGSGNECIIWATDKDAGIDRQVCWIYRGGLGFGYNGRSKLTGSSVNHYACTFETNSDRAPSATFFNGDPKTFASEADFFSSTYTFGGMMINPRQGTVSGSIYSLRLYSRALTAAEIAANYAIDKERFNLP